jgi:hypothetical protein
MQINITNSEAQALAELIDREVRMNGAQAAATFGNIMREMITAAQTEKESDNGENHSHD